MAYSFDSSSAPSVVVAHIVRPIYVVVADIFRFLYPVWRFEYRWYATLPHLWIRIGEATQSASAAWGNHQHNDFAGLLVGVLGFVLIFILAIGLAIFAVGGILLLLLNVALVCMIFILPCIIVAAGASRVYDRARPRDS